MKRYAMLIALVLTVCLIITGCSVRRDVTEKKDSAVHRIGVATYNITDAQVRMFRDYLENYIGTCFEGVEFKYSASIGSSDEMMTFLKECAAEDCEAIMSFNTYDLQKEVAYCASEGMYYIRPSSNSTDEDFEAVANEPYFLGEIGPGTVRETEACETMVHTMAAKGDGRNYVILSGGAFMGIEMHRVRTVAMLKTLEEVYGTAFETPIEELARVSEPTEACAGETNVIICPGFIEDPKFGTPASDAIMSGKYNTVLSTVAVTPLMEALQATETVCGATDCFSEDNYFGFKKNKVAFIAGKYESEIGPAFAAVYNAITGNADLYRPDGKAFRLEQGYWTAADNAEYDSKFTLSSGIAINAYNYEDLYSVVKVLNKDADWETFKALVEHYSYEDALTRRCM